MRFWVLFFLTLSFGGFPLAAESETPISVKAELDRASITIGDPVSYSVLIRTAPNVQVLSSVPYPPKDIFKIRKIEEINTTDGDFKITGRKYTLTAFQLGEYILDPVEVEYRVKGDAEGENSGEIKKIQTSRIFLTVRSVSDGKEQTDIRGLKSTISIPFNSTGLILFGLLLILLILGPVLYRWFKNRAAQPAVPRIVLTPEQEALVELNRLFDSELLREGRVKEYFFVMSEVLRSYLEKRYKIAAVESTTFEIVRMFKSLDVPADFKNKTREVLESADLAKFAKWKPEHAEIVAINKQAREVVESYKEREVKDGV